MAAHRNHRSDRRAAFAGTVILAVIVFLLVAAGCGADDDDPAPTGAEIPAAVVDTSSAIVSPADIHFDTFDGGSVPLSLASNELIIRLLDRIPPIDEPVYEGAASEDWLDDDDLILGYVSQSGQAYAYPIKILNFHEIVNDEIDGVPVAVTYCPLCRSGLIFDRRLDGEELIFGNTSALYENGMVMYDRQTGSYWQHVAGLAITGELAGQRLTVLPSTLLPWSGWTDLYPDTLVLTRDTGYERPYTRDSFDDSYAGRVNQGRFPFPVSEAGRDTRLRSGELVLGLTVGDEAAAFALGRLGVSATSVDVGGEPLVVFVTDSGPAGAAFVPIVDGELLEFTGVDERYVDDVTGSVWSFSGLAVEGPLAGTQLERFPSHTMFWFAHVAAYPETVIYQ